MSEGINLGAITPGMPVYGPNGESLGPIEAIDSSGIRVLNHAVPSAAITRVDRDAVHIQLAPTAFQAASPMTADVVSTAEALAGSSANETWDRPAADMDARTVVPLAEERLTVGTRQMQIGEVAIDKQVVEEQVMVPVTVRREEVEIIHRAPGEPREELNDPSVVEVIRIPLRGEEPVIAKQQVVTSEVIIDRTVQTEQQMVTGTVRSTDVTVEQHINAAYLQARPAFEEHFARSQHLLRASGGATYRARSFRDAEPNYWAGFRAGHDGRYAGRSYEEIEPELHPMTEPAERDPGMLEQIREEVREGFARARTTGAR